MARIFIDGEAGTTGLEIRARLEGREDLSFIRLSDAERKQTEARRAAYAEADIAILCLPDDAARDAVALADEAPVRLIDASSAHRTAPGWTYGLPELTPGQADAIAAASRVTNPGCYPTGAVSLIAPLVRTGLLPADHPVTIHAVSGYSGGGKALIGEFEGEGGGDPFRLYALGLAHKHVEEMRVHAGLAQRPLFVPGVARYYRGMLVQVPLQLWALPGTPSPADLHAALAEAYAGARFVRVVPLEEGAALTTLDPLGTDGTNHLELFVFSNAEQGQALLVARLDNLGKGAAGQAVQSLNLMLGAAPEKGLTNPQPRVT